MKNFGVQYKRKLNMLESNPQIVLFTGFTSHGFGRNVGVYKIASDDIAIKEKILMDKYKQRLMAL